VKRHLFLPLYLSVLALVSALPMTSLSEGDSAAQGDWRAMTAANAPSPRGYHSAIWTGSEMIIWGGFFSLESLDDGKRYTPTTDSWRDMSPANIPARNQHTAIWTGSEMIVWGGNLTGWSYLNDGNRYNPIPNTWAGLAVPDLRARWWHTAIWTGSEMIVWGGGNAYLWVNDGGRYDPRTNSWRAISTANAPSPRAHHTAVWTGREMIIWGGWAGGPGSLGDGKRYDPATDTWRDLSALNAPSARQYHTAIWTGREMIVWGGDGYAGGLRYWADGGRYNPETDSWTPLSLANAPSPRTKHTAVWTGKEMIVWGGWRAGALNDGKRYDPAKDLWNDLTDSPLAGRCRHTAIWTGSEMIVWGGWDGKNELGDGARYTPPPKRTHLPLLLRNNHL
jgi:N-acetylneuraminic acid mutarotase